MNPTQKIYAAPSGDSGDFDFEIPTSEQEDTDHQTGDVEHGPPQEDDES